jgi:hypothetical protein
VKLDSILLLDVTSRLLEIKDERTTGEDHPIAVFQATEEKTCFFNRS